MKRKIDWEEEEQSEREDYSDEERDEEELRIKDVLDSLSQAVSRKRASELLHSIAISKDILFWTPRGQLLRRQRIIPVTNISELVEYVLLLHNDDVAKPRALNTFLEGLAELRVDKRLIKYKKLLSDLLEKEKEYRNNEGSENNEKQSTDSEDEVEKASENSQSQETEKNDLEAESDNENSDSESTTIIQQKNPNPCQHCEGSNVYHTAVMKCPKSFWHDNREICPVCSHKIPIDPKHVKEEIKRCLIVEGCVTTHYDQKKSKETFYAPDEDKAQDS